MKTKSQAQIARDLGISPAYLCQILTGKVDISYKLAYEWSESIGHTTNWWKEATPEQIKKTLFAALSNNPPKTKEETA